jgi:hypothetical protein
LSKYGRCPECEIGDLHIQGYKPDYSADSGIEFTLECNHCGHSEEADWFDPDEEPDHFGK